MVFLFVLYLLIENPKYTYGVYFGWLIWMRNGRAPTRIKRTRGSVHWALIAPPLFGRNVFGLRLPAAQEPLKRLFRSDSGWHPSPTRPELSCPWDLRDRGHKISHFVGLSQLSWYHSSKPKDGRAEYDIHIQSANLWTIQILRLSGLARILQVRSQIFTKED